MSEKEGNLCNARVGHVRFDKGGMYIGRGMSRFGLRKSVFHNPFKLEDFASRQDCINKFEDYLRSNEELLNSLQLIDGKLIVCWCKKATGQSTVLCHGDILIKVRNEQIGQGVNVFTEEQLKNLEA